MSRPASSASSAGSEPAQKLPVKIVFPLILCIFLALLVVLLGPAAISIWPFSMKAGAV